MSDADTSKPPTQIRVFATPVKPGYCRGCNATIDWYRTLNDKAMPMNGFARPQKVEPDPEHGGRRVAFFSSADSHFATCPQSKRFSRR